MSTTNNVRPCLGEMNSEVLDAGFSEVYDIVGAAVSRFVDTTESPAHFLANLRVNLRWATQDGLGPLADIDHDIMDAYERRATIA